VGNRVGSVLGWVLGSFFVSEFLPFLSLGFLLFPDLLLFLDSLPFPESFLSNDGS
jgi:hypothetical protein